MTNTSHRCQIGFSVPVELLADFKATARSAGEAPAAVVQSFLNDYLVRCGEAPITPAGHVQAVSRALINRVAQLEMGRVYDLRHVVCEMLGLEPQETLQGWSAPGYKRVAAALTKLRGDIPTLAHHGVEIWQTDDELRRVNPGDAGVFLAVRMAQCPGLSMQSRRWLKVVLNGSADVLTLTDSVVAMLGLDPAACHELRSAEYHRMSRVRAPIRADKALLAQFGVTLSGRADETVTIIRGA